MDADGRIYRAREDEIPKEDAERFERALRALQESPAQQRARALWRASEATRMLAEFHSHPNALDEESTNGMPLRRVLHEEEHRELEFELAKANAGGGDVLKIARELADVVYVSYGSALAYGIDLDIALREVHAAAMRKMDAGVRRADGKIAKPPGFVPPDMTEACAGASDSLAARWMLAAETHPEEDE